MRKVMLPYLWVLLSALATGTMLVLALPLGEQAWLAWFMLVPLLWATKEKGFLLGFLGGLCAVFWCAFLASTGCFYRFKTFEAGPMWTVAGCGLFGFSFAIFFAIWSDGKSHEKPLWWFAALAVSLESILLLFLPAPLALTQYRNPAMMLVASVFGIWGVSFLVWFLNLACTRSSAWRFLVIVIAILSVTFTKRQRAPYVPQGTSIAVTQIAEGMDKELVEAHRRFPFRSIAVDVWPEFAGMLFVQGEDTSKLKDLTEGGSPIVTSFRDTATPFPHNVASLFSEGQESVRYAKRKLFGKETSMHTPGFAAVAVPSANPGVSIGLNICYDSCFPYIIRETAALPNVMFIALPTIDPDSNHFFIAGMHAAFTPFRCAENGIAMARADGHYGSMVANERGQIVAELHNEQDVSVAKVSGRRVWTVYQYFGDWFWYLCIMIAFGLPIGNFLKSRKDKVRESKGEANE